MENISHVKNKNVSQDSLQEKTQKIAFISQHNTGIQKINIKKESSSDLKNNIKIYSEDKSKKAKIVNLTEEKNINKKDIESIPILNKEYAEELKNTMPEAQKSVLIENDIININNGNNVNNSNGSKSIEKDFKINNNDVLVLENLSERRVLGAYYNVIDKEIERAKK